MQIRIERFDEVSQNYEVDDVTSDERGNLSLWKYVYRHDAYIPDPGKPDPHQMRTLIGMVNNGSWSAVFVLDLEKEANLGLSAL